MPTSGVAEEAALLGYDLFILYFVIYMKGPSNGAVLSSYNRHVVEGFSKCEIALLSSKMMNFGVFLYFIACMVRIKQRCLKKFGGFELI